MKARTAVVVHRISNPSRAFEYLSSRETLEMEGLGGDSVTLGPSMKLKQSETCLMVTAARL